MPAMRYSLLNVFARRSAASLADGVRIYAVGDIHGCDGVLRRLMGLIDAHLAQFPCRRPVLVFLGDYVDRGPDSRGVLDRLIALRDHREVIFLKGNHEKYMLGFLERPDLLTRWLQFGGADTLRSYGLSSANHADPQQREALAAALVRALGESGHLPFFDWLQSSFVCDDFFFVHAGVRPGVPLGRQREEDLLWIRGAFLAYGGDFGKVVVHGHTPVPQPEVRSNRINIDTGAYATGRMTCLVLEGDRMRFISSA